MPSLLSTLEELFRTRDLYEVLGCQDEGKKATEKSLKKHYHRASLKYHPDRVGRDQGSAEDVDLATKKFQALGAVYKILSDPDKRAIYDESGEIDEENDGLANDDRDWADYWRLLFPKITLKDILDFEKKYKNSEEEKNDLIVAYEATEGDMDEVMGQVMCATHDDEPRFIKTLQELIKEGRIPEFPAFKKKIGEAAKKQRAKKAKKEAAEAEALGREMGLGAEGGLEALIMKRQAARAKESESFLDQLAAKYAQPAKKGKKK